MKYEWNNEKLMKKTAFMKASSSFIIIMLWGFLAVSIFTEDIPLLIMSVMYAILFLYCENEANNYLINDKLNKLLKR